MEITNNLGLRKPAMDDFFNLDEHLNYNTDILAASVFTIGNYTSSTITVPAGSYQDVPISISDKNWTDVIDCIPFLYGASNTQKGNVSLQRVNHSTTSATVRVFNAGSSSVSILFRILVFGKVSA